MRASLLQSTLLPLIAKQKPVLLEGTPGLGKTQIIEGIARKLGFTVVDKSYVHLHDPTLQPEDLGLPAVDHEALTHTFTMPHWFPAVGRDDIPDTGLINIDELAQAETAVQKVCANMIQQRELHGHQMKPGWSIVATGNRQEDGAGANRLLSHLRDRVLTLTFDAHLDDWCNWASEHGVRPEVIAFLRFRPDMLSNFKRENKINATPRGWAEGVSDFLDSVPAEAELECFEGRVGAPAHEFVGFLRTYRELPDPDVILRDPERAPLFTKLDVIYAVCGAIAYRATPDNFDRVLAYAKRLSPEFTVMVIRDSHMRCPAIFNTKAFQEWAVSKDGDILM